MVIILQSICAQAPILLRIWGLHNTGLLSRSTPMWRSQCDEMDMTLLVHTVKACLAVAADNNSDLRSTFVPLNRYQLCNMIWSDMTIAVLFLNIFMFFPPCHSIPIQISSLVLHKRLSPINQILFLCNLPADVISYEGNMFMILKCREKPQTSASVHLGIEEDSSSKLAGSKHVFKSLLH